MVRVQSNNSLQRTGGHRGRSVRAVALLRGPVRMGIVPAAELNRYAASKRSGKLAA